MKPNFKVPRAPSPINLVDDLYDDSNNADNFEENEKFSHWDKVRSALLTTPLPGKNYSIFFESSDDDTAIPRIQFGEKEINEEVVNVGLMLNDAVHMRRKYNDKFKFPWTKTPEMIHEQVSKVEYYDGRIMLEGQIKSMEVLKMVEGVFHVFEPVKSVSGGSNTPKKGSPLPSSPSDKVGECLYKPRVQFKEHYRDYKNLRNFVKYAPAKTFCFERLKFLRMKFELYKEMYAGQELVDMKEVPHRDFYNVRKVDNHIHLSACMNQKALLIFMRNKMKNCGQEEVMMEKGRPKTLNQVCQELKMDHHTISVDNLNVHAETGTFHRFDRFNKKFDPFGASQLRKVFLKVDNHIKGRYFAEVSKGVFNEFQDQKYTLAEPRVSIYGRNVDELGVLAHWVHDNELYSENVRWIIQIPRIFQVHKKMNMVATFQDMLYNIFFPLFEATVDPHKDPVVSNFLQNYLVGFDSVDDESKLEMNMYTNIPLPNRWGMTKKTGAQNPPYAYYNYFLWANINVLNQLREAKGMSTFEYRPHCGEAGDIRHLASSFLLADSIAHGIQLRNSPVLSYLYYMLQVGLSVSPLSNNFLFLEYKKNPFPQFFASGFNITLSTDDPLMFHNTREPLMEEYSISQQIMNFSTADICEIARNSVLMSGWPHSHKQYWVSRYYDQPGVHSNNIKKTNVPQVRMQYRFETLLEEHLFIQSVLHQAHLHGKKGLNVDALAELSRKDLIKEIKDLRDNKIQLFSHSKQFNLAYPSPPKNMGGVQGGPGGRVKYVHVPKMVAKEKLMNEREEQEIVSIKNEIYRVQMKIKDLKSKKKELRRRKKALKRKYKDRFYGSLVKRGQEETEGEKEDEKKKE